jgi:hypothetical protein
MFAHSYLSYNIGEEACGKIQGKSRANASIGQMHAKLKFSCLPLRSYRSD